MPEIDRVDGVLRWAIRPAVNLLEESLPILRLIFVTAAIGWCMAASAQTNPEMGKVIGELRKRVDAGQDGLVLGVVKDGSPPAQVGLRTGDSLAQVDGCRLAPQEFLEFWSKLDTSQKHVFDVWREGRSLVIVAERAGDTKVFERSAFTGERPVCKTPVTTTSAEKKDMVIPAFLNGQMHGVKLRQTRERFPFVRLRRGPELDMRSC